MFTFDQIRCFVTVAEELHFGRAAERLQMTQPPLSRQIQKLERAVGVQLLERDNRKVELTPAGEAFLVEARRLLVLASSSLEQAQRIQAGAAGTARIAFTAASTFGVLTTVAEPGLGVLPRYPSRPFRDGDQGADGRAAERRDRPWTGAAPLRPKRFRIAADPPRGVAPCRPRRSSAHRAGPTGPSPRAVSGAVDHVLTDQGSLLLRSGRPGRLGVQREHRAYRQPGAHDVVSGQ